MNAMLYNAIILTSFMCACAAASLTDEQLAQIFNEKPDRDFSSLSEPRDDYAALQDLSDIDQTLSKLLDETDETPADIEDLLLVNDLLNKEDRGTLEHVVFDPNGDDIPPDSDLDVALLQGENMETTRDDGDDVEACTWTNNDDFERCLILLSERTIKQRNVDNVCTSRSCMVALRSLFKRRVKRDVGLTSDECNTVACRISQYVKKSFCNRYSGCGKRRKKTGKEKIISHPGVVYPSLTNVNIFGDLAKVRSLSSSPYNRQQSEPSNTADSRQIGRNILGMCASNPDQCMRQKKLKKVKKLYG